MGLGVVEIIYRLLYVTIHQAQGIGSVHLQAQPPSFFSPLSTGPHPGFQTREGSMSSTSQIDRHTRHSLKILSVMEHFSRV